MKKLVVGLALVLAFIVNPLFACNPFQASFDYGPAEMRAAVEGTWKLTLTKGSEQPRELTFRIAQGDEAEQQSANDNGVVPSAHACANRTFVKSAGACIDMSRMPLELVAIGGATAKLTGTFHVYSTTFREGSLELEVDDVHLSAKLSPKGEVRDISVPPAVTAKLERVSRD